MKVYTLKNSNKKKEKRLNLAHIIYILGKETDFHLPVFLHSTAYEEWKEERFLPNGILNSFYYLTWDKKIVQHYKLNQTYKIKNLF